MKRNILANLFGRFWSILSSFLFIPLYIKCLGFDSYSVISFTLMISGIMAILDGGLTATLSREFARKDTSDLDKKKIFNTLETCYLIVVAICIIIIFFSASFVANHWVTVKNFSSEQIAFFLKIISFEIGFQLLFRFYSGGLLGLEKQVEANVYQVGWGIMRNALVFIPLLFYPTLEVFFIWQAVSSFVFTLLIKIGLQKKMHEKALSFSFKIDKSILNNVGKFAGGMLLIAIVSALNTQLDKITISKALSLENLGYYTLAVSLSQGLIILVNPISTALLPRFTAYYSFKEKDQASNLFASSSLLISVFIFSIMVTMAFFAKDLLWIWTGNSDVANKAYQVVPIVLFSYCMIALQMLPYNIAIANGSTKINNILGIASLIITIPGYLMLTKKYGMIGAAGVFCTVQFVTTLIYFFYINKHYLNLKFLKDILLIRFLLPLLVVTVIVYCLKNVPRFFEPNRFFDLIWIGVCFIVTLSIVFLIFIPIKKLRSYIHIKSLN